MVSIIIPNFNHAKYLRQRITSALSQTCDKFEVIILDDCSNDNSKEIILNYIDSPKISKFIVNEVNSGSPFAQWRKGIELAQGELIWIAESDDFSTTDFLEKMVKPFDNPEVVLTYCNCEIINQNNEVIYPNNYWMFELDQNKWLKDHTEDGKDFLINFQRYRNVISNASGVVFRKKSFENLKYFPTNFKYAGDWLFWNQLCSTGKVAYISEPLNKWRVHENTTRKIDTLNNEFIRLKETTSVINFTLKELAPEKPICVKCFYWITKWWLTRYNYRYLFKLRYLFPCLPSFLYFTFYHEVIKRTCKEMFCSLGFKGCEK